MIPRGEVGLIFATIGLREGVLGDDLVRRPAARRARDHADHAADPALALLRQLARRASASQPPTADGWLRRGTRRGAATGSCRASRPAQRWRWRSPFEVAATGAERHHPVRPCSTGSAADPDRRSGGTPTFTAGLFDGARRGRTACLRFLARHGRTRPGPSRTGRGARRPPCRSRSKSTPPGSCSWHRCSRVRDARRPHHAPPSGDSVPGRHHPRRRRRRRLGLRRSSLRGGSRQRLDLGAATEALLAGLRWLFRPGSSPPPAGCSSPRSTSRTLAVHVDAAEQRPVPADLASIADDGAPERQPHRRAPRVCCSGAGPASARRGRTPVTPSTQRRADRVPAHRRSPRCGNASSPSWPRVPRPRPRNWPGRPSLLSRRAAAPRSGFASSVDDGSRAGDVAHRRSCPRPVGLLARGSRRFARRVPASTSSPHRSRRGATTRAVTRSW